MDMNEFLTNDDCIRGKNGMKQLTALALLTAFSAGTAQANTLTFDEPDFGVGTAVTSFSVDGVTGSISATGGVDQAIIFDTTTLSGGDDDLVAPFFADFDADGNGIGPGLAPGNVLIIAENDNFDNPDDNGSGGTITFTFDKLVDFLGFRVFDDVTNFVVTSDLGETSESVSLDSDNQFAEISTNFSNVSSLTFNFGNASGAIDNLQFVAAVPVPASLPLLLAGFGAFGFAARRKARKSA